MLVGKFRVKILNNLEKGPEEKPKPLESCGVTKEASMLKQE